MPLPNHPRFMFPSWLSILRVLSALRRIDAEERDCLIISGHESVLLNDILCTGEWQCDLVWTWKHATHINLLESNSYVTLLRMLASQGISGRFIALLDSRVAKGCHAKGRSSAKALVSSPQHLHSYQFSRAITGWLRLFILVTSVHGAFGCCSFNVDFPNVFPSVQQSRWWILLIFVLPVVVWLLPGHLVRNTPNILERIHAAVAPWYSILVCDAMPMTADSGELKRASRRGQTELFADRIVRSKTRTTVRRFWKFLLDGSRKLQLFPLTFFWRLNR